MTSANVTVYTIYKDGKYVATFRMHHLTRYPEFYELLKYQPLDAYSIQGCWLDEEEEQHIYDEISLDKFLRGIRRNSVIRAYFDYGPDKAISVLEEKCKALGDSKWNHYIIKGHRELIKILKGHESTV